MVNWICNAALGVALCALLITSETNSLQKHREQVMAEQRTELDAIVAKNRAQFEAEHDMPGAKLDPVKKCVNACHAEHCDCHIRCAEVEDPLVCAQRCNEEEKGCPVCQRIDALVPR